MKFIASAILRPFLILAALALAACGGGGESAEPVAAKAEVSTFKGHGSWWNPSESGSGFFFEAQGSTGVVTFYSYEANGRPVWYLASGPFAGTADGKFQFSGTLLRYSDGQPGSSAAPKTPTSTEVGPVSIVFLRDTAQVQVPGRSYSVEKFYKTGQFAPADNLQPETGAFWNPEQGGRGYVIEVANGKTSVAVFHYADDGEPTWNLVTAPVPAGTPWSRGVMLSYSGGQTLSGAYKAPMSSVYIDASFAVMFSEPCNGKLGFPHMPAVAVKRFAFGSLPAGAECRTPKGTAPSVSYANDVQLTLVSPTSLRGETVTGVWLPANLRFSTPGNATSLKDRGLFFVSEDAGGAYQAPSVTFDASGVMVSMGSSVFKRAGRYSGEIRLYGCLHPTCAVQIAGSPFVIPYDLTITQAPVIGPVDDRGQCAPPIASRTYAPGQLQTVEALNASFSATPGTNLKALKTCLADKGQPGFADVPAEVKALAQPDEGTFMKLGTFGQVDQVQSFSLSVRQEGVFDILPGSGPTRLVVYATGHDGKWSRTVVNVGSASGGRYALNISPGRLARSQGLMYVSRMKTVETGVTWTAADPF